MADTDRIKRNLSKMVDQGAPEADLDAYLKSEGFNSADEWRAALAPKAEAPRTVGAAMAVQTPRPAQAPAPTIAAEATPSRSWSDIPGEALRNLPTSALNFATSAVQPLLNPLQTATGIYELGKGIVSKGTTPAFPRHRDNSPAAVAERDKTESTANAVGDFFVERYGGVENIKNTLATDPVGSAADAAAVLTLGGNALARAPGVVGRAGQAATRAGALVDPLTAVGTTAKTAGKLMEPSVSNALGMTTGAGADSIRAAGRAGLEGGEVADALRTNMRGEVPVSDIVDRAKGALDEIRQERNRAYNAGKVDLSKDTSVIPFDEIDASVGKASGVGTFKGQSVEPKAVAITQEMQDSINTWRALDPTEFHTPEGIDALKRNLGNIRDSTKPGSPERVAADRIYNAVKDKIVERAPAYAGMMADYAKASDKLKEVSRTFSLGERASGETAARKLQSVTRNNANTSFGQRQALLEELAAIDPSLPFAIAGQSLNALAPRGLVARLGVLGAAGGGLAGVNPLAALALPAFSPRFVGEAAFAGGRAANALAVDPALARAVGQGAFQSGRADEARSRALALRSANALR